MPKQRFEKFLQVGFSILFSLYDPGLPKESIPTSANWLLTVASYKTSRFTFKAYHWWVYHTQKTFKSCFLHLSAHWRFVVQCDHESPLWPQEASLYRPLESKCPVRYGSDRFMICEMNIKCDRKEVRRQWPLPYEPIQTLHYPAAWSYVALWV